MLFNSLAFLLFLPLVFSVYWMVQHNWRWVVLLAASYYFYFSYNPWFCLLLFGTTGIDYIAARKISAAIQQNSRKAWLLLSVFSNIGVLVVFKYSVFLLNTGIEVSNSLAHTQFNILQHLIIPAGLSFYTFQSLSYTIDVYRNKYKAQDSFGFFSLYVSFFPHMVAGPVVRYNDLMPQFYEQHKLQSIQWALATRLCIWGFFKKMVIADRLGEIVTPVFNHVDVYSGSTLLVTGFLFVVQVYCDFSGYSDIATGVAKYFGINLSLNWRRPLLSKSFIEFWQRNHISITTWFRDYLYISLGGNRCSYKRWLLNIFLVFLISGLWHGANWTFVIWGAVHGLFYVIELINSKTKKPIQAPKFIGWLYLLLFHTLTLIAFRALNIHDLGTIYYSIIHNFNPAELIAELKTLCDVFPLVIAAGLILFLFAKELNEEYAFINRLKQYNTIIRPVFYIGLFLTIFLLGMFNANEFIYFQF